MLVNIRGAGTNTTMLHSDIQVRLAVPTDPSLETTGASTIFDRNINSNTVLGLDLASSDHQCRQRRQTQRDLQRDPRSQLEFGRL